MGRFKLEMTRNHRCTPSQVTVTAPSNVDIRGLPHALAAKLERLSATGGNVWPRYEEAKKLIASAVESQGGFDLALRWFIRRARL